MVHPHTRLKQTGQVLRCVLTSLAGKSARKWKWLFSPTPRYESLSLSFDRARVAVFGTRHALPCWASLERLRGVSIDQTITIGCVGRSAALSPSSHTLALCSLSVQAGQHVGAFTRKHVGQRCTVRRRSPLHSENAVGCRSVGRADAHHVRCWHCCRARATCRTAQGIPQDAPPHSQ